MLTLALISNLWMQLEESRETQNRSVVNNISVVSFKGQNPLLVIDSKGQRHLLIPVNDFIQEKTDLNSAGIKIYLNEWADKGLIQKYVDIVCLKPHLNSLFDHILFAILQELEKQPPYSSQSAKRIIDEWREFIDKDPSDLPSESIIKGLFGELYVLHELAKNGDNCLDLWLGPESARNDFKSGKFSIEVKTISQHIDKLQVTINGLDQLWVREDDLLFLIVIRVEKNPKPKITIEELIDLLLVAGIDQVELMIKLQRIGLTPNLINKIPYGYDVVEVKAYLIDESFPKITPESFKSEYLNDRVFDLRYTIDLIGEPPRPLEEDSMKQLFRNMVQG